jgi:hypothetical protein
MKDVNPDLIRLVASRYGDLRGLRTAGDASVLLVLSTALLAAGAFDEGRLSGAAMTMAASVVGGWFNSCAFVLRRRLDRYYTSRFGRVAPKRYVPSPALWLMCATSWMGTWCDIPGPAWVRAPLALAAAIPLVAWAGWIARRDAPFRAHWALVAIAFVVITLQLPIDYAAGQLLWRTRALLYGGGALLMAGIGDHLILLRAMPRHPEPLGEAGDQS